MSFRAWIRPGLPSVMMSFRFFPRSPGPLKPDTKALPSLGVLHLSELESDEFSAGLLLSWLLAVDYQGAEHHFLFDADLPDLAADTVQEEELHGVGQSLVR